MELLLRGRWSFLFWVLNTSLGLIGEFPLPTQDPGQKMLGKPMKENNNDEAFLGPSTELSLFWHGTPFCPLPPLSSSSLPSKRTNNTPPNALNRARARAPGLALDAAGAGVRPPRPKGGASEPRSLEAGDGTPREAMVVWWFHEAMVVVGKPCVFFTHFCLFSGRFRIHFTFCQ